MGASLLLLLIVLLVAAIPLINLVLDAGLRIERVGETPVRRWSLSKAIWMVLPSPWSFRREFGWTMVIAASAACASMAVSIPLGWWARRSSVGALPALLAMSLSAAVPGPVVGLAIIAALNREHWLLIWLYDRTVAAPVLAAAVRALPVTVMICWWAARSIPPGLVELGRLDGLGWIGMLRHVAGPTRRELYLAGWCAGCAMAAGDLSATLLVTPPGVSTLPIRIFGLLHAGVDDLVAGICLSGAVFYFALALLAARLFRSRRDV